MDGFTIGYSTGRRTVLFNRAAVGYTIGLSRAVGTLSNSTSLTGMGLSQNRRAVLTDFTLVGYTLTNSTPRGSVLTDFTLVGYTLNSSFTQKAGMSHQVTTGLCGISFILSDRQIIKQRPALQGISMVLSDRQIVTQQAKLQGISMILSDQQIFDFSYGFNAINVDAPTDEQVFDPIIGMNAILIETDNPGRSRGYIIKKS